MCALFVAMNMTQKLVIPKMVFQHELPSKIFLKTGPVLFAELEKISLKRRNFNTAIAVSKAVSD